MTKEKKLTPRQCEVLLRAEDTLFGDAKLVDSDGRTINALASRGLVEGDAPHVYLTPAGKEKAQEVRNA